MELVGIEPTSLTEPGEVFCQFESSDSPCWPYPVETLGAKTTSLRPRPCGDR